MISAFLYNGNEMTNSVKNYMVAFVKIDTKFNDAQHMFISFDLV